ncbi:MAG: hypothetical protein U0Q18_08965 [Bryobacteraceae bacterium]
MPAPLGDLWSGLCKATEGTDHTPDSSTLRQFCNFGYARSKCGRCPSEGPDAVRFCISKDRDDFISIYWVMEKDHLPFGHGSLEYSRAGGRMSAAGADAGLVRQAEAYVSSYLLRKEVPAIP